LLWIKALLIEFTNERFSPSLSQQAGELIDVEDYESVINLDNIEFDKVKGKIEPLAQRNQGSR